MNLADVDPHTIALWFALGCVGDVEELQEFLPYVQGAHVPDPTFLESRWPDMVRGIGEFTHTRVIRYWCYTHLCTRENTSVMVGVVTAPYLKVAGYAQVKTAHEKGVRCTPYHNPRDLVLTSDERVLVHGFTIAMTVRELQAWEAGQ